MLIILSIIQAILVIFAIAIGVLAIGLFACFFRSGQISEQERQREIQEIKLNMLYGSD